MTEIPSFRGRTIFASKTCGFRARAILHRDHEFSKATGGDKRPRHPDGEMIRNVSRLYASNAIQRFREVFRPGYASAAVADSRQLISRTLEGFDSLSVLGLSATIRASAAPTMMNYSIRRTGTRTSSSCSQTRPACARPSPPLSALACNPFHYAP